MIVKAHIVSLPTKNNCSAHAKTICSESLQNLKWKKMSSNNDDDDDGLNTIYTCASGNHNITEKEITYNQAAIVWTQFFVYSLPHTHFFSLQLAFCSRFCYRSGNKTCGRIHSINIIYICCWCSSPHVHVTSTIESWPRIHRRSQQPKAT